MEHNTMRREKRWFFVGGAAVVLAVALAASFVIWLTSSTSAPYQPTYPQETRFEDSETRMERRRIADGLEPALIDTIRSFGAEMSSLLLSEENTLYSPVSLYLTLALCAETADGATRNEIITALRQMETSDLRETVPRLFQSLTFYNGVGQLRLASSLWLNNQLTVHEDSLLKREHRRYG